MGKTVCSPFLDCQAAKRRLQFAGTESGDHRWLSLANDFRNSLLRLFRVPIQLGLPEVREASQ